MKQLTIISLSNLKKDPRVKRQINYLKTFYSIRCVGFTDPEIDDVEFIDVSIPFNKLKLAFSYLNLLVGRYNQFYWKQKEIQSALKQLKELESDLFIANDIDVLPLCLELGKSNAAKIIFDAHEFSPLEHNDSFLWRLLFKKYKTNLIQKYASKANLMLTVCDGIAEKYTADFGLHPLVITNASDYVEISIKQATADKIRLIHHGIAMPTRKIENMIEMMDFVDDRFELDLMLVHSKSNYYNKLNTLAKNRKNVNFISPVASDDIIKFTSNYDLGIYILEPTNLNNHFALPNKLFEFIQARLAIAIGPSPEMAKIVKENDLGIVAVDFNPKTMADALNLLTQNDINQFKENSANAAKRLNSEVNMQLLKKEIDKLLS
jgi:glycosyltransferase involved in cell wall biosynthesis